jgi:hypothetical protein
VLMPPKPKGKGHTKTPMGFPPISAEECDWAHWALNPSINKSLPDGGSLSPPPDEPMPLVEATVPQKCHPTYLSTGLTTPLASFIIESQIICLMWMLHILPCHRHCSSGTSSSKTWSLPPATSLLPSSLQHSAIYCSIFYTGLYKVLTLQTSKPFSLMTQTLKL